MLRGVFTKHFGEKCIFQDFTFSLKEGVTTALLAPSGRGKTTLLRLLCGLEENEAVGENDFSHLCYSYLFQEDRLIESWSAFENVRLVKDGKYSDEEILSAFSSLSLDTPYQKVSEYSGGMKRRVAILRSLFAPYDILLLDEPFKGLDEELLEKTAAFVRKMTEGRSVILVTHEERDLRLMGAWEEEVLSPVDR